MYACYVYNSLKLDDLIAPGRQDLSYLGLQLVAYIYDEATETRVILCRGHDRLVSVTRLMVFNYLQYSATVTHILYCLSDAVLRSAEINSTDVAQVAQLSPSYICDLRTSCCYFIRGLY
jgi:hypothetical protein